MMWNMADTSWDLLTRISWSFSTDWYASTQETKENTDVIVVDNKTLLDLPPPPPKGGSVQSVPFRIDQGMYLIVAKSFEATAARSPTFQINRGSIHVRRNKVLTTVDFVYMIQQESPHFDD